MIEYDFSVMQMTSTEILIVVYFYCQAIVDRKRKAAADKQKAEDELEEVKKMYEVSAF